LRSARPALNRWAWVKYLFDIRLYVSRTVEIGAVNPKRHPEPHVLGALYHLLFFLIKYDFLAS
jgi:hypothetical protein